MKLSVSFNFPVKDPVTGLMIDYIIGEFGEQYQQPDGSWWINCVGVDNVVRGFRATDIQAAGVV